MSRQLEQATARWIVRANEEENFGTDYKKIGLGLGVFSIGLVVLEVAAPERIARWLGANGAGVRTFPRSAA